MPGDLQRSHGLRGGTSPACPSNVFAPSSVACRGLLGNCDLPEFCTGNAAACPVDRCATGGTCRGEANGCDVPEPCDGTSPYCPQDLFAPDGTPCPGGVPACGSVCTSGTCGPDCGVDGCLPCQ